MRLAQGSVRHLLPDIAVGLPEMMRDSRRRRRGRCAMLGMKKFDIAELRAAYEGK
jgi:hypothetical protein